MCLTGLAPSPEDIRRFRQRQLTVSARIGQATEPLCGLMAWGMAASPAGGLASPPRARLVFYFHPTSDTWSGTATLVFTSPVKGSWSLPLSMGCTTSAGPN